MVMVLKNDQMKNLLPMSEEIVAIEHAFLELGQGKAMNAPPVGCQQSGEIGGDVRFARSAPIRMHGNDLRHDFFCQLNV